ncbi:hypothetical protein [Uliginosibacterium sediminicola]|uniref:Secreted protein n=1 Tax=Uliginosibacterium sediminicola TaxID=2024550 RepID=A0ABU9Z026_9RHOO
MNISRSYLGAAMLIVAGLYGANIQAATAFVQTYVQGHPALISAVAYPDVASAKTAASNECIRVSGGEKISEFNRVRCQSFPDKGGPKFSASPVVVAWAFSESNSGGNAGTGLDNNADSATNLADSWCNSGKSSASKTPPRRCIVTKLLDCVPHAANDPEVADNFSGLFPEKASELCNKQGGQTSPSLSVLFPAWITPPPSLPAR